MPKGRVEPREVTCRGCDRKYISDRPGKAAWFCDTCKARRGKKAPYVPVAERDPERAERARLDRLAQVAAREQAKLRERERRQAERDAARERQRAEREARQTRERAEREAARRAAVEQRVRDQREADRQAKVAKARADLEQAVARHDAAGARVAELRAELADLEPPIRIPRRRLTQVAEPAPIVEPRRELTTDAHSELGELLAHLRRSLIRRALDDRPVGKIALHRAIRLLTQASGIPDTRRELRALAVEALAWDFRLSGRDRDPGGLAADDVIAVA